MQWMAWLIGAVTAFSLSLTPPPAVTIRAAQSGHRTLDQGAGGGNPFASALIELLRQSDLDLPAFSDRLVARTRDLSGGFQIPDIPDLSSLSLRLGQPAEGERRVALILVISDYSFGLQPLPGASRDARRIQTALRNAGFETVLALDPRRDELDGILGRFATASAQADVALVYTTGHGIEIDGVGYLLNDDFPAVLGLFGLRSYAIPLARISDSMRARSANLFFYAGCRDNPFR